MISLDWLQHRGVTELQCQLRGKGVVLFLSRVSDRVKSSGVLGGGRGVDPRG